MLVKAESVFRENKPIDRSFQASPNSNDYYPLTTLGQHDDFLNGFFCKDKDIGYPYSVETDQNTIILKIALAGFHVKDISIQNIKNLLILSATNRNYDSIFSKKHNNPYYSLNGSLKTNSLYTVWRIPKHKHIASTFRDGMLIIYITLDKDYEIEEIQSISIDS